jgi:hypothetical protein
VVPHPQRTSMNAHLTATDRLRVDESDYTMDSNIPRCGKGSDLGGVHVDEEISDGNRNPGNVVRTDQVDWALDLPVTPFVPTVSLPLNLPPAVPSVPLVPHLVLCWPLAVHPLQLTMHLLVWRLQQPCFQLTTLDAIRYLGKRVLIQSCLIW